jgi:fluoroacetyl-CoA thioesterase
MKPSLQVGLRHEMSYTVPESKTVPHVFDDSDHFAVMPKVLATAFLVGLLERACVEALHPHLDWPTEQTVGTAISISHSAATPPGLTVTVQVELTAIDRRRLTFEIVAHDGVDEISRGTHERFVIDSAAFADAATAKAP